MIWKASHSSGSLFGRLIPLTTRHHYGPLMFYVCMTKLLNKQSNCRWFQTSCRSCDWCLQSRCQVTDTDINIHVLWAGRNCYHFVNGIFRCMFQLENVCGPNVPELCSSGLINKSVLVRVMACRLFGAKPLPEPMLTCSWPVFKTPRYAIRPQWVNLLWKKASISPWNMFTCSLKALIIAHR